MRIDRVARPVELGHENALPLAQHDFPAAHRQRQAVAEQERAQMRVGVHAVAVREARVVVPPVGVAGRPAARETP